MNNDQKPFDVAKEVGLDPNDPNFETDNLKLNLQMMLYVMMNLIKKDESLVDQVKNYQEEFVQKVKNKQIQ